MNGFARIRWSSIAGAVFFSAFVLALSRFWVPEEIRQVLKAALLALTAAVLVSRYAVGFQGGVARFDEQAERSVRGRPRVAERAPVHTYSEEQNQEKRRDIT